ncbi:HD domain-containing protein [Trichostrongylus colubriformis]|uniref:HD domain-containing protein n=1 Tax=Trichostrongylus colubriformis TaxID=6319 RepID=A0AAN8GA25_TRICO
MKDDRSAEWPPLLDKRQIQDMVHGPISLFSPLDRIVDTREFQRLRDLKQLGVTHLVYPCSTHSRFVHSLGTYWLAFKFVESLKRDTSLNISGQDHLCVSLAALCHDLGHGPFSHLFDGIFRDASKAPKCTHESLSIRLLRRIVDDKEIREALEQYLGKSEEFEKNITFTEELISSQKFDPTGRWLPRGRPVEKAFLFDIVANDNDSCDVDKFDYLVRDSLSTGIAIPFNKHSFERLMENAKVLPDPRRGFPRICYAKKVADIALSVGDSRQMLHNVVYQHRVVRVIEAMVVRAMVLADKHLSYIGDDGVSYSLSEVTQNLGAYLKTSDDILREIANSDLPEMAEAQSILRDIERRNIPVKLEEVECGPSCTDMLNSVFMSNGNIAEVDDVKKMVSRKLGQILGEEMDEGKVMVLAREMHRGLDGRSHPISRVLLYDNKKKGEYNAYYVDKEWLRLKVPQEAAIWSICLYVSRSMPEEQRVKVSEAFKQVVTSSGLRLSGAQRDYSTI